jgi:hypothetical protein
MSLSQFNQTYPSVVGLDVVALINGLSADAQLQTGQQVKRVIGG